MALQETTQKSKTDEEFEQILQDFINNELSDIDAELDEVKEDIATGHAPKKEISETDEFVKNLYNEEKALFLAYRNFAESIDTMAAEKGIAPAEFILSAQNFYPRYKPFIGETIFTEVLSGWDIMIQCHPAKIAVIQANAKDEELLDFAERESDEVLQLAIISYVEILIEIEGCEIAYESRRLKAKKRRIERKIYEEHAERQARIKRYIEAIRAKQFPIDAERLVFNYFKTAKKDPDGAYQMLTTNPATYAPIDISQIPNRFFGLIKTTPKDGIRMNREIARFLKNLKA